VIVMFAIGRGASASIQERFNSLGSNMLIVFSGSTKKGGVRGGRGTMPTLRVKDAEAIGRECPAVRDVAYIVTKNVQIVSGTTNWGTTANGTTPDFTLVKEWPMKEGQFFNARHFKSGASVAVLGATVAENLFGPGEEIIGQRIRIRNFPFRIIGVLSAKGSDPRGRDQDDAVFVPYTTAQRRLMGRRLPGVVYYMLISAQSREFVPEAKREIEELLRQRHRILPDADDDFTVLAIDEYADMAEKSNKTMTLLLIVVATVSLIVGGIGIMNIMLVSVTERTREIGIRMAVGARERDVLVQFLVEAITMSIAGGLLGTAIGVGSAKGITLLAEWPTIVTVDSILIASTFSGIVGILAGFYPAFKASRLDPIEALRYE
jgi:putative ABC transport system permease protein